MTTTNSEISFKSYCWSLGTTSFRTAEFNRSIEAQLEILDEFWSLQAANTAWNNDSQEQYYDFMYSKKFVTEVAPNKAKDARVKTSGLVDLGFVSADRRLTEVGRELLRISKEGDFASNNDLRISKDSYIYLSQLLKTFNTINGATVRPFIVLLYLLDQLDYLQYDEYTYLLPLCINADLCEHIIEQIRLLRNNATTIDDIILEVLMGMTNYDAAYELFMDNEVSESLVMEVGFNRKGSNYDKPYFGLYQALKRCFLNNDDSAILSLYEQSGKVAAKSLWRDLLFNVSSERAIQNQGRESLKQTKFVDATTEDELKTTFFKYMHLFKAKKTLMDYRDLNTRYIKTSNVVLFSDGKVELDLIPKHFFKLASSHLPELAFTATELLQTHCDLRTICPAFIFEDQQIIAGINTELGTHVETIAETINLVDENRLRRFNELIDREFSDEALIQLLNEFDARADERIKKKVSDNATVPTIFEYVLAIIWYKLSQRHGNILDFMRLSLDADFRPISHATGGDADVVYQYKSYEGVSDHTLLIEATLAESTGERVMEMEPVSRHLGNHLLREGNSLSYCVFVTNNALNINLIADFRQRNHFIYYDTRDTSKYIEGMKILPIQTSDLRSIIQKGYSYSQLYEIFEEIYRVENHRPLEWHQMLTNELN